MLKFAKFCNSRSTKITPEEFYDNFAKDYDLTVNGAKVNAQNTSEAVKLFHKHNPGISSNVLDIGCGTGLLRDFLGKEFEYTGIDVSGSMLEYASQRGYKVMHKKVEDALPQISDLSYDFVFALSSLQFVRDISFCLSHINRIARKSIVLSLDDLTEDFLHRSKMECYNYSQILGASQ